jgi:hypothetical protein
MNSVYIFHHLGLGDHIIANGIVRTIAKKYDKVYLFCKSLNFKNVSRMYKDLPLKLILMEDPNSINFFMSLNPKNKYIISGGKPFWDIFNKSDNKFYIDEIFYQLAGVPIENKWKEFYIERDLEREKYVYYNILGLKDGEEYSFIHDTAERRITKNIPKMKIIKPNNPEISFFDFIYTIENAKEIHCINSSFFCLIECMLLNKNLFLHKYARTDNGELELGLIKANWKIIK